MPQIAEVLRWPGTPRALWKWLRRREASAGIVILSQNAPGGPCWSTLSVLRETLPECFRKRDYFAEILRERFEDYERRMATYELKLRALGARVRQLSQEVEALGREVPARPARNGTKE
jgi:hypothetical protein